MRIHALCSQVRRNFCREMFHQDSLTLVVDTPDLMLDPRGTPTTLISSDESDRGTLAQQAMSDCRHKLKECTETDFATTASRSRVVNSNQRIAGGNSGPVDFSFAGKCCL